MEIFRVEDLNFTYPDCSEKAVSDVNFKINKGEFIVLCGSTGSGKSTLLRLLKPELSPNGDISGNILFHGTPLSECNCRKSAASIGFVMQSPEQQIVTPPQRPHPPRRAHGTLQPPDESTIVG